MSQANLKGVSGVLFIGVSRKFKGGFKKDSRKYDASLRLFKGCSVSDSMFQRYFKVF